MISQGLCASLYTHVYYSTYKAHVLRVFTMDIHVFQYGKTPGGKKDEDNNCTAHEIVQMGYHADRRQAQYFK